MSFLYPVFLSALLVLAIPVLVHLFHFRRYKTVLFSNVRFLRNIETERKNRNRLKHLLVLTSRCLAFASLVLAFAIPGCGEKTAVSARKSVRIFIDNSYSMERRSADGILFETAKQKARDIVRSLEANAEFQIISNDLSDIYPRYVSASEAIHQIDKLGISARSESLQKVWNWLQNNKPESGDPNYVVYCISDFQNVFLRKSEQIKNPDKHPFFGVKVASESGNNLSLDTAWLLNPFALAGEKSRMNFRVSNFGNEDADGVNIKLKIGTVTAGLSRVSVPKGTSAIGSIELTMPAEGQGAASLELEDANSAYDNVLFVSLHSRGNVNIVTDGSNSFLNSALKTNSFFKLSAKGIASARFPEDQVLYKVINTRMSDGEASALSAFVNAGGKAVLVPAENMPLNSWEVPARSFGIPLPTAVKDIKVKIRKEGLSDPFFNQVFQSVPANIEMPVIQNYYSTEGRSGTGESILSLENGDPFLLHFKQGKGDLYVFSAPFAVKSGNFVQSVLFFPVIANCAINNQLTGSLFGFVASGKGYLLHHRFQQQDGNLALLHNSVEAVPEIQNGSNGQELFIGSFQNHAGFYTLTDKKNASVSEIIALNDWRVESDPALAPNTVLTELEKTSGVQWLEPGKSAIAAKVLDADSGLWRLFIWLAAAFFAVEILLLVFWDKATGIVRFRSQQINS